MQTAADRVDSDLREAQTARGLGRRSNLRRQVLVAIDGRGQSEYLVRIARRIAERRDAPWTVVSVQIGESRPEAQQEIERAFALARRLGGSAELLHGSNVSMPCSTTPHAAARLRSSSGARASAAVRARMLNRTITQQLLQRGAHYELTIVSTTGGARAGATFVRRIPATPAARRRHGASPCSARPLAVVLAGVAERWLGLTDLSMVFIVAVLIVATRTRMAAAVLAAVLCFLAYNFFFIAPRFTFYISAQRGVTTVLLFLGAALLAGRLAAKLRSQVHRAARRPTRTRPRCSRWAAIWPAPPILQQVEQAARVALRSRARRRGRGASGPR